MKPVLSICMMVKNEEKNMDRCLRSLLPLMQVIPSELIIVDTGSTDRTVEIANQFTDKVLFHMWNNNFSEMRNLTIDYATGQWVLIIDADEEIETTETLISFLKARPDSRIGCATMLVKNITNGLSGHYTTLVSPRLFRRNKHFHYIGAVHNEPLFQGGIAQLESSLIHYGYIASDKELMEDKFRRTSTLLQSELKKNPDNIYYRYQLSTSYSMHGDWVEALQELQKVYELYKDEDDDFWHKHLYVVGGFLQACAANGRCENEIIQFGLRGIKLEPEYVDLYFYMAQLYEIQDNSKAAYEYYVKHIELVNNFSELNISHNITLHFYTLSFLTTDYYCMGVISFHNGNYVLSRRYLQQMLAMATEDDQFISQARTVLIGLDFVEKNFSDSRMIYDTLMEKKLDLELAEIELETEKLWQDLPGEDQQRFCQQFQDLPNLYGKLNRLRLYNGDIGEAEWQSIFELVTSMDMNILPAYYGPVLAYCMKFRLQEACQLSACLSEKTIVGFMSYLDEVDKIMFVAICWDFINIVSDDSNNPYQMARLQKNIAKYLLFSGELNDNEYKYVFNFYIDNGQSYMKLLYNCLVFENELICDLKNKEETFLLYITLGNRGIDHRIYMHYLKKALEAFPEMHKGIDGLLQSLQNQTRNLEMEKLTSQLLASLLKLVEMEQFAEALVFIEECKGIIGDNVHLLAIEAEIIMKKMTANIAEKGDL